jgi:hypothetical protein
MTPSPSIERMRSAGTKLWGKSVTDTTTITKIYMKPALQLQVLSHQASMSKGEATRLLERIESADYPVDLKLKETS